MARRRSDEAANDGGYALEALAKVLSRDLVAGTLVDAGKLAKRACKLPPDLVAWLVIAMGVFRGLSIPNVLARIVEHLGRPVRFGVAELPHATTIAEARDRLGWEVMRTIFLSLAHRLAVELEPAVLWHGLVVRALDGTSFMTPDSRANDKAFGRPGVTRGGAKCGYPRIRAVFVLGVFTHIITQVILAPYRESELAAATRLATELSSGTLLLMDRLYYSFEWLAGLAERSVPFVVRAKTGKLALKIRTGRRLPDGSREAKLVRPYGLRDRAGLAETLTVRAIRYRCAGFRTLMVVTNLRSHEAFPAHEVGALYHARWEIELGCRELKTYQAAKPVTFRSKTPDRIQQEAYGLLIAFNCVRGLMAEAAVAKGVEPRRLSFTSCLERIREAITASDDDRDEFHTRLLAVLGTCVLAPRRVGRRCPRAVKLKMSKFPRKRPGSSVVATSRYNR